MILLFNLHQFLYYFILSQKEYENFLETQYLFTADTRIMSYDRTFLSSVRNCSKRKEFLAKGIFMIVETCGFKIRLNECRIFILNFLSAGLDLNENML